MKYTHTFHVHAPLEEVSAFHSQSASMAAITPPPVIVQIHSAPDQLGEGDEMDFTMWLGPIPIRWLARIEQVTGASFVDRQVKGPFAKWEHTHSFERIGEGETAIHDQVIAELGSNLFSKAIGLGMWLNMPVLFAYRQWKTRRILEGNNQLAGSTVS